VYYLHDLGLPYTDQAIEIKGLTLLQQLFMNFMTPILGLFNKDIFKSADYIIANSHTSSSYLSNHYKCTANAVIYPGINRKIFKPSSKKLDYVYTVGRLEKLKNIDQIIHGFSHYHRMNPASKTSLFIIGEGNEKTHLIKLVCSYNMGTHIKFLGRKNNQEISAIASRAKIGIFLSPYESFGITVMESLASGTPVIGINKNGIKELIKTNKIGILVDGSTLSISNAINKLMKNPVLLSTMSKNASIYASRFDWDTHIKKLHSFFMNM
jgi:glycosyltransferase involved in cell wall biosynthesis